MAFQCAKEDSDITWSLRSSHAGILVMYARGFEEQQCNIVREVVSLLFVRARGNQVERLGFGARHRAQRKQIIL